jgi:hypothetical protein
MWLWITSLLIVVGIVGFMYLFLVSRTNTKTATVIYGQVPSPAELKGSSGEPGRNGTIVYLPQKEQDEIRAISRKNRQLRDQMLWFIEQYVLVGLFIVSSIIVLFTTYGWESVALLIMLGAFGYRIWLEISPPPPVTNATNSTQPSQPPGAGQSESDQGQLVTFTILVVFCTCFVLWLFYRVYTRPDIPQELERARTRLQSLQSVRERMQTSVTETLN